jgi:hypothetical protein
MSMTTEKNNACNFFIAYCEKVWDRIRYARAAGNRISEVTITENLLFDFWYASRKERLPVKLYEAKAERLNGNDLEMFIETSKGFLRLCCQAKMMSKRDNYPSVFHEVRGIPQIELLLNYASKVGGIPVYLLYNYTDDYRTINNLELATGIDAEHYGISCCSAQLLDFIVKIYAMFGKKMKAPYFKEMHPHMGKPFGEIICEALGDGNTLIDHFILNPKEYTLEYYQPEYFEDNDDWERVLPPAKIGFITPFEEKLTGTDRRKSDLQQPQYRPKYRLVITREPEQRGIRSIS